MSWGIVVMELARFCNIPASSSLSHVPGVPSSKKMYRDWEISCKGQEQNQRYLERMFARIHLQNGATELSLRGG